MIHDLRLMIGCAGRTPAAPATGLLATGLLATGLLATGLLATGLLAIGDWRLAILRRSARVVASLLPILATIPLNAATVSAPNAPTVILVVGAPGEAEFGSNFVRQVSAWDKACARAH